MERKEYSAGAVKLSFWFMEFRKVVGLLNEGKTIDEIKQMNKDQNIFGAPTADRSEKIFRTLGAPGESYLKSFVALRRRLTT